MIVLAALLLAQTATVEPAPVITEMHATPAHPLPKPKPGPRITGPYTLIPVKPGVTCVPKFGPSGQRACILSAWRDNGNAWGNREYEVFIPARNGEWNIVDFNDPKSLTHLIELPHIGEDAISTVRFMWGFENGRRVALVAAAGRNPQYSVPEPGETTLTIYSMRVRGVDVGTSEIFFKRVKEWTAKHLYCNAEMALHDELGLPLSKTYQGSRKRGGCFD